MEEEKNPDKILGPQLQDHHKAAIIKAFDVAVRNSNENAVQFGTLLGEVLIILGIAKNE